MVRVNITIPEDLSKELSRVRNKSQFIAQALREKFQREKKKTIEALLIEGYKKTAEEDQNLTKEWERTIQNGWD